MEQGEKMKGYPPKPAALSKLEGNPSKRKPRVEIAMPLDMPTPPQFLDSVALEEWGRLAIGLNAVGVLSFVDMGVMAAYCDSFSTWYRATQLLNGIRSQSDGELLSLVQVDGDGIMYKNPLLLQAEKAKSEMIKYASELGMTPVARARIAVINQKQTSEFDGLLGANKK